MTHEFSEFKIDSLSFTFLQVQEWLNYDLWSFSSFLFLPGGVYPISTGLQIAPVSALSS